MAQPFIHSIIVNQQAISADGQADYDLPVNPLTLLLIHLSPLNETSTPTNYAALAGLLSAIDSLTVSWRGASVIDMSGADLAAWILFGTTLDLRQSNFVNTDNDRRSLVIPIPFGRRPYDPGECFPAVKRGELILSVTWDIADTGFDGLRASVESVELPGANPTHFVRATTLSQTFAATGDNDVDLPIGNVLRGVLCFGTTAYTGASPAPTLGQLRLLVDNVETHYTSTDFEVSRAISAVTKGSLSAYLDHFHYYDPTGAAATDTPAQEISATLHDNYTYLDLDPTADDAYALDTKQAARVHLRVNAETADAARFIPIEKVAVSDFIRPAPGVRPTPGR